MNFINVFAPYALRHSYEIFSFLGQFHAPCIILLGLYLVEFAQLTQKLWGFYLGVYVFRKKFQELLQRTFGAVELRNSGPESNPKAAKTAVAVAV